jgi:hypothetical protein
VVAAMSVAAGMRCAARAALSAATGNGSAGPRTQRADRARVGACWPAELRVGAHQGQRVDPVCR